MVLPTLSQIDIDRIIEMAWEDRTPFDAIKLQFGLSEDQVVWIMQRNLLPNSWRRWRKRVSGRKTKHKALSNLEMNRFKCSRQKSISSNRIT